MYRVQEQKELVVSELFGAKLLMINGEGHRWNEKTEFINPHRMQTVITVTEQHKKTLYFYPVWDQ